MENELKKGGARAPARRNPASPDQPAEDHHKDAAASAPLADKASEALDGAKDKARQVKDGATDAYQKATTYTKDGFERASTWASDRYENAARSTGHARRRTATEFDRLKKNADDLVRHNPIMIGVAGLAAGLLVGALLPRTQRENEAFGRLSDELREQGKRYALDLARDGKDRVVEAFESRLAPEPDAESERQTSAN